MAQKKGHICVAQHKCPREAEERRGEEREGTASVGEATGYITAMHHMFGITLMLIHMQHAGHSVYLRGNVGIYVPYVWNYLNVDTHAAHRAWYI
jgi:hypothetical protein